MPASFSSDGRNEQIVRPLERDLEAGHPPNRVVERDAGEQRQPAPPRNRRSRPEHDREGQPGTGRRLPAAVEPAPSRRLMFGSEHGAIRGRLVMHQVGIRRLGLVDDIDASPPLAKRDPEGVRVDRPALHTSTLLGGAARSVTLESGRVAPELGSEDGNPAGRSDPRSAHHRGQARRSQPSLRRGRARRLGARGREAAREGQEDRPRARRRTARRGLVHRVGRVRATPVDELRAAEEPPVRRRRRHRLRHGGRPSGLCVQPGRDGVRRRAGRGVRREDREGARLRDEDRLPGRRHQRGRRRADPGRRGQPRASTARSSIAPCTRPASSRRSR